MLWNGISSAVALLGQSLISISIATVFTIAATLSIPLEDVTIATDRLHSLGVALHWMDAGITMLGI